MMYVASGFSRTFTTAAAVLTLAADPKPFPRATPESVGPRAGEAGRGWRAARAVRRGPQDRRRRRGGRAARQARMARGGRPAGSRDACADDRAHALPHLFDDEVGDGL